MSKILSVEDLKVQYPSQSAPISAVDSVSFSLDRGSSLGITGESGSGKSTLAHAIMGIIPSPGRVVDGRILVGGEDIAAMSSARSEQIKGDKIALIFQGAMNVLNPFYTINDQMQETIRAHRGRVPKSEAKMLIEESIAKVRLGPEVLDRFPHELSGGMKQRVVIGMALMLDPEILIADEPTSSLDVIVQAQITNLLKDLQRTLGLTLILITHDLALVSELSDFVAVMYAGRFVEYGRLTELYNAPKHPYTHLLLRSVQRLSGPHNLSYISGQPPNLQSPPNGCRFNPRCPYVKPKCIEEDPKLRLLGSSHQAACHRSEENIW